MQIREYTVFDGYKGWDHSGVSYRLACGAVIAETSSKDLLCTWLSGSNSEPATDNCVLISRSSDAGKTWGEPEVIVPSGDMAGAVTVLSNGNDGMYALGAYWPADKHYTEWHWFRIESYDDGMTWGNETKLKLRRDNDAAVLTGIRLSNGSVMLPGQFFERRRKPFVGPVEGLANASTEEEAASIEADESRRGGNKFSTHLHGCCVYVSRDGGCRTLEERGRVANRPLGLLEPTVIELREGRITMLMRAEWGGFLWRADSDDGGYTWTEGRQTDIPDPTSLSHVLRLPDGRIALLHNASGGRVGFKGRRDPLSIWISDDEMETWSVHEDIIAGGQLAYPNGLVRSDGTLVFVYDHDRRLVKYVEVVL